MKIKDLNTPYERKQVLKYKSDGNTLTWQNKELQQIKDCLYRDKGKSNEYGEVYYNLYLKYPESDIHFYYTAIRFHDENMDTDTIFDKCTNLKDWGGNSYADLSTSQGMVDKIQSSGYIKLLDLEFLKYVAPELVESNIEKRNSYLAQKDKEEQERRQARLEKETKAVESGNQEADKLINEALKIIQNGGVLKNSKIDLYELVDGYAESKTYNLINHLANIYNVKIPIKVKGWITDKLYSVTIENNRTTGYKRYTRDSNTFIGYMDMLINAVVKQEEKVS